MKACDNNDDGKKGKRMYVYKFTRMNKSERQPQGSLYYTSIYMRLHLHDTVEIKNKLYVQ